MKLDKKKILEEAEDYFGSKRYGDGTYDIAEDCVELGQVWLDTYRRDYGALMRRTPKEMRKELKSYIKSRLDYSKYNATFIPTFIWTWLAQIIISWIVNKIINNII